MFGDNFEDCFYISSMSASSVPFLAVRSDYHPKRNQARQKLATLATGRFKDLASDVYYEVERRFPQVVGIYVGQYGDNVKKVKGSCLFIYF